MQTGQSQSIVDGFVTVSGDQYTIASLGAGQDRTDQAGSAAANQVEAVFTSEHPAGTLHGGIQKRIAAGMHLCFPKIIQSIDLGIIDTVGIVHLTKLRIAFVARHMIRIDIQVVILTVSIDQIHSEFLSVTDCK